MRFVILILLLVSLFNENVKCSDTNLPIYMPPADVEIVHNFNEVVKRNIPQIDPIMFDLVELSFPGEMFSANVNISQGSIYGLSNYRLIQLQFSKTEPAVSVHILFPFIKLHAEYYEFDGHVFYAVPMKGQGLADFDLHNLQLKGTIYLKKAANGPDVVVDKYEDAEINLERIVSRTEFDHNIDSIINSLVQDLLAGYINRFNKYILLTYSETIIEYINHILTNNKLF